MILALENFIDQLKNEEELEYLKRKHDHQTCEELGESYRKSDRARWTLNLLYDQLVLVLKNEYSRPEEGEDTRTSEQKAGHQQIFGLIARIGQRR